MSKQHGRATASATETFFDEVGARAQEPLLKRASGSVRFDVVDGERVEHWTVRMRDGGVTVSRRNLRADAVVRLDRASVEGMAAGRVNAMAAVLRGELVVEGDLGLVLLLQRIFPAPPARAPARPAASGSERT